MGLMRFYRGLGAITLTAVFLTGCSDDGDGDDASDDTSSETSETPSEDPTTEATTDATTEATEATEEESESVDPNALTEPSWVDSQYGSFTATDVAPAEQPVDGAAGLYVVAIQGDDEAQGPKEPGTGPHDHVIALLAEPTPCALYKLKPAKHIPAEVVTTDKQGLALQINLGSGFVPIDNNAVIDQGLTAGLLKTEFQGITGMCTSAIG